MDTFVHFISNSKVSGFVVNIYSNISMNELYLTVDYETYYEGTKQVSKQ